MLGKYIDINLLIFLAFVKELEGIILTQGSLSYNANIVTERNMGPD